MSKRGGEQHAGSGSWGTATLRCRDGKPMHRGSRACRAAKAPNIEDAPFFMQTTNGRARRTGPSIVLPLTEVAPTSGRNTVAKR